MLDEDPELNDQAGEATPLENHGSEAADLGSTMVSPYLLAMADPNLATVRARRAELARLRKAIDDEDNELEVAERALTRLAASRPEPVNSRQPRSMGSRATHRELIGAVLKVSPDPWIASPAVLRAEIERTHGVSIKPTSFQPLLSTLKKEGVVVRNRLKIALADRVRQERQRPRFNGAPDE